MDSILIEARILREMEWCKAEVSRMEVAILELRGRLAALEAEYQEHAWTPV